MIKSPYLTILLAVTLIQAIARENIQTGEESGIPKRADSETSKTEKKKEKKETRENQEDTDPVFYDSTTSPGEMKSEEEN